jgi:hypothetical protein
VQTFLVSRLEKTNSLLLKREAVVAEEEVAEAVLEEVPEVVLEVVPEVANSLEVVTEVANSELTTRSSPLLVEHCKIKSTTYKATMKCNRITHS